MNEQQLSERKRRGYEIFQQCPIDNKHGFYRIPSSKSSGTYKVSITEQTCTCPDFEIRKAPKCKHIFAAEFHYQKRQLPHRQRKAFQETAMAKAPKRPTYQQTSWSKYNQSQVTEKAEFLYLLKELVSGVETPSQKTGRTRHSFADLLFAMCYKVYSRFSSRRFMTDLNDAFDKGYIERKISYNSLVDSFNLDEITPILHQLIEVSSLPLSAIEKNFCVDSTAFSTCRFGQWQVAKHKDNKLIEQKNWVKAHVMSGISTHVVTAVTITDKYGQDGANFSPLVEKTAENFTVGDVSADAAYALGNSFETVSKVGGTPFIDFRKNASGEGIKTSETFKKAFHFYSLHQSEFWQHYSKRNNAETVFSMVKGKFGDSLRTKTERALINESLVKFVCHNICVLITSIHELGLKPKFRENLK